MAKNVQELISSLPDDKIGKLYNKSGEEKNLLYTNNK